MNKPVRWNQIKKGNIPDKPGVYAWYYKYTISKAEILNLESDLAEADTVIAKRKLIEAFFRRVVFEKFDEEPYLAKITGKLKPNYTGSLVQDFTIANSFIDKILEEPKAIYDIRDQLNDFDISFSSPLYIGMAGDLLDRILQHRDAIIDAKSSQAQEYDWGGVADDGNFAKRFTSRKLNSTNLYVVFKEIESENSIHNPMEYILNRINYPLLGRN